MSGEHDRVATLSDLLGLEARLITLIDARLDERLGETAADVRQMIAEQGAESGRYVDTAFEQLTERMKPLAAREDVQKMIAGEGANTRRYFDMMVERMADLMKPLADGFAHHAKVLDDHESRLQRLEE